MTRIEFLKNLYAYCEGLLELRALPSKSQEFYNVIDYQSIDKFCEIHKKENVYFSVALRSGKDGTKESITQIACLHCDVDFKDIPEKEAVKAIQAFQFKPTLIVRSGGGFHLYWRLKEAYGKEDIPDVEKTNRALATALKGDLNACDASRILRMPGTWNVKPEYGKPRKVVCSKFEHVDYDVSDFEGLDSRVSTSVFNSNSTSLVSSKGGDTGDIGDTGRHGSHPETINFTKGHRDSSLFHVANCLVKGGMTKGNTAKVLNFLAGHCSPAFSERETIEKMKSALSRQHRQERSLSAEIREWVEETSGDFSATFSDKELKIETSRDKKNRTKIFNRLCDEGLIERTGTHRGWYRLVEKKCEDINFKDATAKPVFFRWPLPGLEHMIEIFPGNVIVIAGVMNAGKSAFMFDFTFKNMADQKIYYFTSEMGAIEMRKRLLMFNTDVDKWNFEAKERSSNFPDVIYPDAVNIIDYVELHDNFYQISGILKGIHDKLKSGIALVALQKNPGAPTGIGGYRGLEKPRLYLSLDGGVAKIVKAKNWATTINPNGYSCKFKLISGCHFIEDGEWTLGA